MPRSTDLPEDLKPLVSLNALRLTSDSFEGDLQRLAAAIRQVLEKAAAEEWERLATEQRQREEKQRLEAEARQEKEKERLEAEQREKERLEAEHRGANRTVSSDPAFFNSSGWEFQQKGDYDKAISDYSEAIRLNPNFANVYHNRGCAYRAKGNDAQAQADFDKAKQLGYNGPR